MNDQPFVHYVKGDLKEAVEKHEESQARIKESVGRRLGSKLAAEEYLAKREKQRGGRGR